MIVKKVFDKISYHLGVRYEQKQAKALLSEIRTNTAEKTLYLFCAPTHSNLGDQAQLMCWLRLFKEFYPDYKIIRVPTRYRCLWTIPAIREKLKKDDLLFIHSGYLIYDPHPELPFIQDIVHAFYDRHITILPQTVNLMAPWFQHVVAECFNNHPDLTLMCRDEVSLEKAKALFPKVKLILMPDVVTSLIGNNSLPTSTWGGTNELAFSSVCVTTEKNSIAIHS